MINERSCVIIHWWMIKLGLNLTELMIYATIYSFTNGTKDHCFHGSASYLGEWACISRQNVMRNLKKLEENNLISRKERIVNGVKFVDYSTATGCPEMRQDRWQNATSYNRDNNSISISNDIDNISYHLKEKSTLGSQQTQPLGPLPEPVENFLKDSYEKYPSTKYQIDKQWSKYFLTTIKDFEKLCQEYSQETVYTVLNFIKQDEFRCKQIQSIGKLRKKNKDWIPYMVVIMDKIQQCKPKVIDLDQYK